MNALITAALALGGQIMMLINQKEATKYIDDMEKHKQDILDEIAKGDLQNDAKIEHLQGELKIILDTITQAVIVELAKKNA